MFKFITIARKALLAAALVLCSGAAFAFPSYQVTIHTQAFSGEAGLLDLSLGGYGDGAPMTIATLWNISGAFGEQFDRSGAVTGDIEQGLTFTSGPNSNYLTQSVLLGGDFVFNIAFSGPIEFMEGRFGTTFAAVLYDAGMTEILDIPVQFDLIPAFNGDAARVAINTNPATATVIELVAVDVPEPSQLLLMLSALALAGVAMRRSRKLGK